MTSPSPRAAGGAASAAQPAPAPQSLPRVAPPISPESPATVQPGHPSFGQPPPISPEIAKGGGAVIAGLMIVGLLGGLWLMRPQPGRRAPSLLSGRIAPWRILFGKSQSRPRLLPATQSVPSLPATGSSSATGMSPGAGAPAQTPAPPQAPQPATPPAVSRDEETSQAQYAIVLNLLRRKQTTQARLALQQLVQKYPRTQAGVAARDLLTQIPEEVAAATRPAGASAPAGGDRAAGRPPLPYPAGRDGSETPARRQQATSATPAQPQQEATGRVFTTDDVAGRRPSISTSRRASPSIPASLQSAQAAAPQSIRAAVQDDVRMLEVSYASGDLTLTVEYNLASAHTRPVFLGAWLRDENVSRRLGYTAARMASGRATARIVLPGVPAGASNLRIVFFEEKGDLFFTKDFNISK